MAPPVDDFGGLVTRATRLWTGNFGNLLILSLVFVLVCWIPIANVGFLAGYTRAILKVARGEKAEAGDIFRAWDCFGDLFVYLLLVLVAQFALNHVPGIGQVAGFALAVVVAPGMYGIIDRRMKFMDAFRWSLDAIKGDFVGWLLAVLVGGIFMAVGAVLLGFGIIITLGWGSLVMALQYDRERPRVIIL
ncbi:zinc ribbon domain-containing protein [Geobacter grbiciae]|uniref:zinc ribbon domain-containing protein n=1 Tax=Geobacter grbiciae TaxID=155042 RepID=UPI001C023259|nr:zinc ribbon domain-containing protein [Geobacter grbiciae]MBT1073753.1 zinc ribbon domain-containing protein [Geobacter grbiciae]